MQLSPNSAGCRYSLEPQPFAMQIYEAKPGLQIPSEKVIPLKPTKTTQTQKVVGALASQSPNPTRMFSKQIKVTEVLIYMAMGQKRVPKKPYRKKDK